MDSDSEDLAPWPVLGLAQTALGLAALVLAVLIVMQSGENRDLQGKVEATQAQLAKSATFANLDNSLIQLLAKAAVDTNDTAIRDLLGANGVTIQSKSPTPPTGAAQ
jgi:hypothetical protein